MFDVPTKFDLYHAAEQALRHNDIASALEAYAKAIRLARVMARNKPSLDAAEALHKRANLLRRVGAYGDADADYLSAGTIYVSLKGDTSKEWQQVQYDWSVCLMIAGAKGKLVHGKEAAK